MRRPQGFVLLVLALSGCIHPLTKPRDGLLTMKKATGHIPTSGEPLAAVASRLVEQPAGSDYLNRGLWLEPRNPLNHELTTLLAVNGLRVGVVSGPSSEFQRFANSEANVLNPSMQTGALGRPRVIPVNGPIEMCHVAHTKDLTAEGEAKDWPGAECGICVTPTAAPGGKVKLTVEFQLQHGERQVFLQPSSDGSAFARHDHRPTETFPTLRFEVILNRDETLILGATEEPAEKLGQAFFVANAGEQLRQRIVLIQAGLASDGDGQDDGPKKASRSAAAQAAAMGKR
jgi:hypothetical protein